MTTSHPFRTAVEARDIDGAAETLSEDVVFPQPRAVQAVPRPRRREAMLSFAEEVLSDFDYADEVRGEASVVRRFRARVGERELEGIDFLNLDRRDASPSSPCSSPDVGRYRLP